MAVAAVFPVCLACMAKRVGTGTKPSSAWTLEPRPWQLGAEQWGGLCLILNVAQISKLGSNVMEGSRVPCCLRVASLALCKDS
jgi:hypothetical protein